MDNLKLFCIIFCVLSLVGAFTGIHGVHLSYRGGAPGSPAQSTLVVNREKGLRAALFSMVWALAFASAAYGIHRRARIVWKIGWGVLGIIFFEFAVQALSFLLNLTGPDRWFESAAFLAVGVVPVYWGFWWKRQKGYFHPRQIASRNTDS